MSGGIFYKKSVAKDLNALDASTRKEILSNRLKLKSKKLSGDFKGLYRFRTGNYRVIYAKIPQGTLILRIAHRKDAYS